MSRRRAFAITAAVTAALFATAQADAAATLSVDDDGAQCPAAAYDSVQDAIDAAAPGDTISVCPGTYTEGTGAPRTNALTITKSLTIKGAGADLVEIQPRRTTVTGGQIAAGSPVIRDGVGNIIAIVGGSAVPISVNISGVTIDGNGVYSEVGVLYLDATGSLVRSRVTNVVTSEADTAYTFAGGYRSNNFGYGVAQVTAAATPPPGATPRPLLIDNTRIDKYNKLGVLIDGAINDNPPLTASGVVNAATIRGSSIIGRVECQSFKVNGNCSSVGLLTTGPTFGQEGLRVTAGSTANVTDSILSQNLVNGTGAPFRNSASHNANLPLGSGARFIGAGGSSISTSNVVDNSYGVQSQTLDGSTPTATQVPAENNWWGLRYSGVTDNVGPAISPTTNPQVPENPVNGAPLADPSCLSTNGTAPNNSTAVDFCPFRNGTQGDPNAGEWPVVNAPLPISDAKPTVDLQTDKTTYAPGETVILTATASDDFGVSNVTFYDGSNALTIDPNPPYTTQFTIPGNGACGTRTFTAVSKDSAGQTASDSVQVTVEDGLGCAGPPEPPTIAFDLPLPSEITAGGVTISATAHGENGVQKVDFYLGNRLVCTDMTSPYACNVLPNGGEIGDQILRAVVTDTDGQAATVSVPVTVQRFPADLTIHLHKRRISKKMVKRTISGRVVPADRAGVGACASGTVTLDIQRDGFTLFPSSQVPLKPDCTYFLTFTIKERKGKKRTYDVGAAFSGNTVLLPETKTGRFP